MPVRAFTIMELAIVMAIVLTLAAFILALFPSAPARPKEAPPPPSPSSDFTMELRCAP